MNESVGKRIKDRRKELKMTQEALAKASNISRGTIAAIESGKCKDVLVSTLTALAIALDTTVESFLP